ncbi:hypothetical protein [Dietzia sp.]|uniref:hypothetical protein n=1 Tax=Dietzia sp. TaxID=1871616 RepID=UPI002FD8C216
MDRFLRILGGLGLVFSGVVLGAVLNWLSAIVFPTRVYGSAIFLPVVVAGLAVAGVGAWCLGHRRVALVTAGVVLAFAMLVLIVFGMATSLAGLDA